jgi:uncharacterized membrane protein
VVPLNAGEDRYGKDLEECIVKLGEPKVRLMATVIKVLRVFVGFALLGYGLFVIFVSKPAFSRGDNELAIRLVVAAIVLVLIAIVLLMPDAKRLTRRDRTTFLVAALLMSHGGYWVFAMAQAPPRR